MSNARKHRLEYLVVAFACVALFVGALIGVYAVGMRHAQHKTEETLDYACYDLPATFRGSFYSSLMLAAEMASRKLSVTNPPSPAEMRAIVDGCSLDELYLVSRYGKVLAAADPSVVGRDLTTIPAMMDFLSLVDRPDLIIEQPIRLSLADATTEVSYGGFPGSDGSLILCGFTVDHLRQHFVRSSSDIMSTWEIGENGGYAVVDDTTGKLVFDVGDMAKAGELFAQVGDAVALTADFDVDTTQEGTFFGCRCHYRVFDFYGLRVVAFVSHDEHHAQVKRMVLAVAVILALVFVTFGAVFHRVAQANRAIAKMREAEDRQRIKDMVMATSIQKHSLPTTFPPYPALVDIFDIYAFMQTAKEVGGDFYDFYFVGQDRIALVMADVSGKGVPAAMFMMRAKTTLQGLLKSGMGLVEAVSKTNDRLCEGNLDNIFVTVWAGVCDLATGEIEYVNAGHNPPLIRRADGAVEWVRSRSGLVVAAMEGSTYRPYKLTLAPGDGLVLYTDGVTEAQNPAGGLYGEDRFERATLGIDAAVEAHGYCDAILASISQFAKGAEQADDITMLAFRLKKLVTA